MQKSWPKQSLFSALGELGKSIWSTYKKGRQTNFNPTLFDEHWVKIITRNQAHTTAKRFLVEARENFLRQAIDQQKCSSCYKCGFTRLDSEKISTKINKTCGKLCTKLRNNVFQLIIAGLV